MRFRYCQHRPGLAATGAVLRGYVVVALSILFVSSPVLAQVRITEGAQAFLDAERDARDVLRMGCWYSCGFTLLLLPPLIAPYFPTPVDPAKLRGKSEAYAKRYKEIYHDIASDVQFKSARAGMFTAFGIVAVAIPIAAIGGAFR